MKSLKTLYVKVKIKISSLSAFSFSTTRHFDTAVHVYFESYTRDFILTYFRFYFLFISFGNSNRQIDTSKCQNFRIYLGGNRNWHMAITHTPLLEKHLNKLLGVINICHFWEFHKSRWINMSHKSRITRE
jgi:hypothetical protein